MAYTMDLDASLRGKELSPLADEILTDLPGQFPQGASIPDLVEWLGEPKRLINKALKELLEHSLIHREGNRYHIGPQPIRHHQPASGEEIGTPPVQAPQASENDNVHRSDAVASTVGNLPVGLRLGLVMIDTATDFAGCRWIDQLNLLQSLLSKRAGEL